MKGLKIAIFGTFLFLFSMLGCANEPADAPPLAPEWGILAENLQIPWEIAFLPEGGMLITQRGGTLLKQDGEKKKIIEIGEVRHRGESGLLGMALHPRFEENRLLYLYFTVPDGDKFKNRVERFRFEKEELSERKIIIDDIPGAVYHDGGRLKFGPDGHLYITTGDATLEDLAQNLNSLAGKILRVKDDGGIPADNPFGTAVFSYGHRNPQGIAWDEIGRLWATEHGRSGELSGLDEINLIVKGGNYGWPVIEGDEKRDGMISPVLHSGPDVTWAPSGMEYKNGSLFFAGLRGESLYEAKIQPDGTLQLSSRFKGRFGRLRAVVIGPDEKIYFSTSNTDGRGTVREGDDKIIKF